VDPSRSAVSVDGRRIGDAERSYWALHKPRGYVTTRSDPSGRKTVYDLLGDLDEWVVPVGRLDLETSGLLLLTNDTQFAEYLTNPDSHVEKTYRVTAKPRLGQAALERLRAGVVLKDGPTRPAVVKKIGDRGPCTVIEITITEGRNRQVRRMIVEVGSRVLKLARVSIGAVALGDLAAGKSRRLTPAELRALGRARSTKR
jgi:pseudouridine synthase